VINSIVVHPHFDAVWPFAADRLRQDLEKTSTVEFVRVSAGSLMPASADASRLFWLGAPLDEAILDRFPSVREAFVTDGYQISEPTAALLERRGIRRIDHSSEAYWAQSVAEFALGLTIGALRRIPQTHREMLSNPDVWEYPQDQFGDNPAFTCGTVEGKRVRIVGAGNIGGRFASFTRSLGADVAAWDPFAAEAAFDLAGAKRVHRLARLAEDAEIFAPMVPLTPATQGLVTGEVIRALPNGCLVVLVTRAGICDMVELRKRVLSDELALAADVFDIEPLPVTDPLLGRHNVVHTPHNAGRTLASNLRWADLLADQTA
jgi:phosphoglycerate dehydrogenase-like enzyme